jgi:hypothetical protein
MARRRKKYKVSKAEKEILILLREQGYEVQPQFRIEGVPFIYDFYFPTMNLLLEYNGDYFHANPSKYKSGSLIKMLGLGNVFVDYIWDKDKLKQQSAEKQGFIVKYLWEEDYKKLGWKAIEPLL